MGQRIAIVGGGIVGICTATALARSGREVVVLERHGRPFEEASTHNSGVVHAGIYYPPGSLKARSCVEGNRLTWAFCTRHEIPHRRCGKLVFAYSNEEARALRELLTRARANGATGVEEITPAGALAREPHIRAPLAALLSADSGVLETASYLKAREREALRAGVEIVLNAGVRAIHRRADAITLETDRGELEADVVVNAAGLWTDRIEELAELSPRQVHPCRGEWWSVRGPKAELVSALIYPVPGASLVGLGVHLTPQPWSGELLVGPNAVWVEEKDDYARTPREPAERFLESARHLLPALEPGDLHEAYTGLRAKLSGPGEPPADFEVAFADEERRLLCIRGIESPGLTAAPALAGEVVRVLDVA